MTEPLLIHGTTVAVAGRGVLLRGPSGSGKSDFALRLIAAGACLVADDQSEIRRVGGRLLIGAPAAIAGLIEARGIGILRLEAIASAPLALVVDLAASDRVERLPMPRSETILGITIPAISLAPFEASAVAKLLLLLSSEATTEAHALGPL